jgi:hypothetical protein
MAPPDWAILSTIAPMVHVSPELQLSIALLVAEDVCAGVCGT